MGKKRIIAKTEEEILRETSERESVRIKADKAGRKSKIERVSEGKVFIQSTYNNTIITVTDMEGNVLVWATSGSVGFKGPKKATPFAASKIVESLMEKIRKIGLQRIFIFVKGVGSGREAAIRALVNQGLEINQIKDVTSIPHNGCRPPKVRRV